MTFEFCLLFLRFSFIAVDVYIIIEHLNDVNLKMFFQNKISNSFLIFQQKNEKKQNILAKYDLYLSNEVITIPVYRITVIAHI